MQIIGWIIPICTYTCKREFIIEKQLPLRIIKFTKCLAYPLPLYTTQIVNPCPFLNLRVSANHDKSDGSKWGNPYKGDCFSIVESLLYMII